MPSRDRLKITFFITLKKILSAKSPPVLLLSLIVLTAYVWLKDSFSHALKLYGFLFPHFFLFLSQDMFKDEVDSGALENVLFLQGQYKGYLFLKNLASGLLALAFSLALFLLMICSALTLKQPVDLILLPLFIGAIIGGYYVCLGGFLSFFFRAGSNVLIIVLGQVFLALVLLLSATQRVGFIDDLLKASSPGISSRIKILAVVIVFPNLVIADGYHAYAFVVAALAALFLILQKAKMRGLELVRK